MLHNAGISSKDILEAFQAEAEDNLIPQHWVNIDRIREVIKNTPPPPSAAAAAAPSLLVEIKRHKHIKANQMGMSERAWKTPQYNLKTSFPEELNIPGYARPSKGKFFQKMEELNSLRTLPDLLTFSQRS